MSRIRDDRTRVLVVTADEEAASIIRQTMQRDQEFVWCGWATDMTTASRLPKELVPDVVVSDVFLPGLGGAGVVEQLVSNTPRIPVVVLTHRDDVAALLAAVKAGAYGYVIYGDGLAHLDQALRRAMSGKLYFSDSALELMTAELGRAAPAELPAATEARTIVASASLHAAATLTDSDTPLHADDVVEELTPRELQVMGKLALGLDNRTIGRHLGISDGTVSTYVKRIREKLGARSRGELMAMSARLGTRSVAS